MDYIKLFFVIISVIISYNGVSSLNILGIFPYGGKSHFFVFQPYLKELVRRGHNVTVVSHFPQEKPINNYHDISIAGKEKVIEAIFPVHRSYGTVMDILLFLNTMGASNCKDLLANEKVQNLWKSKVKFDLVVVEQFNTECPLGLAYKLGAPVVSLTSCMLLPWQYEPLGIQYNPSYVPYMLLEGGTKPTLLQRVERTFFHAFTTTMYKLMSVRNSQAALQEYFDDVPPLQELARDVKLTLLYTNSVLTGSGLYPPSVKEVGGYHVAKPKELPEDMKKFIDESEHGVIYISFGSMLRPDLTPQDKVEAIVGAISELPQRVIWKWDAKLPGNPKNLYIAKWMPQNDILAHPKVLAFYSHCGMLGTTEAIYHGVPMIGMPVFGDQPANAAAVEESGLGVQISIKELTKETLLHKMKTVLNPEFRRKVKELSRLWHDTPITPMDSAVFWTEYAARNKNYTFRTPAATVPLYQYLYLDVIAVTLIFLLTIYLIFKKLLTLLCSKKKTTSNKKVKTK